MTLASEELLLRESLAVARDLHASTADVDEIMARLGKPTLSKRVATAGRAPVTWIAVVAAVGGLMLVPPVRAGIGDVANDFATYFSGEDTPGDLGRTVGRSDSPPPWITQGGRQRQRLLASAGGEYELYVVRERGGEFGFALGGGVAITDSAASWQQQLADNSAVILGPGSRGGNKVVPIYGVTAGNVDRVELAHGRGESVMADATTGGFVVLADLAREPGNLTVLDDDGQLLQTIDLAYIWSDR